MCKYEKRWQNVIKIAERINWLMEIGCHVFDGEGRRVLEKFEIREDEIVQKISINSTQGWYTNDPECDDGPQDTMEEYAARFEDWTYVHPADIKKLLVSGKSS